jgi:DNA-binding transcriptional ArsR family regulator
VNWEIINNNATTILYYFKLPHIFTFKKNFFKKICETKKLHIYLQLIGFIKTPKTMRRDIFQAVADPTRRAIIVLIASQAMTPNAIAENFNTTRQAVSKHLRILTECQLVKQEQKGREIYYSLEIDKMKEIDNWMEQFKKIWETKFNQLDNLLSTIKNQKK